MAGISPQTVYDKINFVHRQCLAFVADRERMLAGEFRHRLSRPPLSLKKMSIRENGEATVISYTSWYSSYLMTQRVLPGKDRIVLRDPFLVGTDTTYPPARIAIYTAVRIVCLPYEGQMVGYAACDAACPCWMEGRTPTGF